MTDKGETVSEREERIWMEDTAEATEIKYAWRRLAATEDGKKCLTDLADKCCAFKSPHQMGQSTDDTLVNVGAQQAFFYVAAQLGEEIRESVKAEYFKIQNQRRNRHDRRE